MNKAHRTLFNTATGTYVAVSELATGRKKSGGQRALVRSAIALAAVALSLGASHVFAAPTGADACTTADGQHGVLGEAGVCAVSNSGSIGSAGAMSSVGTMGSIGTTAALDDTYIKVLPATLGGTAATASGTAAVAIGNAAVADGTSVLAFGSAASATGTGSMAFGRLAKAIGGTSATAIGNDSTASGTSVLAIGSSATATGTGVVALGRLATATSDYSTALGNQTSVLAAGGVALGTQASVSAGATNSVAIGNQATVDAKVTNAMALGTNSHATRNDTISVGSSTKQRQITNMASGTQDTDAVNVSQLEPVVAALGGGAAIDPATGVVTGPTYGLANGGTQHTVGDALGALDGELTTAKGDITQNAIDITNINSKLNAAVTNDYVKINTVAAPAQAVVDSIAIGGAATANGTYSVVVGHRAAATGNNATALGVDAEASGESSLALGKGATAAAHFSSAIGVGATASGNQSVALGIRSVADRDATVSVGSATLQRQIVNMAAGTEDTDAVNVGQLKGVADAIGAGAGVNADGSIAAPSFTVGDGNGGRQTFDNVSDVVTNLDGRVTTNESDIAKLADQIGSGTTGLVQQAAAGADITVGANTDGAAVNFAGTTGERKLTGVANGDITAGSTDAVTGGQLFATNRDVAKNTSDIADLGSDVSNLGTQVTNIDGRVAQNETHIAKNTSDIADLGSDVSNLGTQVTNIDGRVTQNETHIAKNTTDIADLGSDVSNLGTQVTNIDGRVTQNETHISKNTSDIADLGSDVSNLGTQVTNIDGRVTQNETHIAKNTSDITLINDQLAELSGGTIGLVQQAAAGADLTVGANTDGAAVNFAGTAGERKLTGLANGDVAAGSTDAVTGDQLHAVAVDVTHLDQRVTNNETSITQIRSEMNNGSIGLVKQAAAGADLTVGANTDGAAVNFAGTAGERKLTGLANGDVAAGSRDAVTGDQLHATNEAIAQNASDIADNRTEITNINNQLATGQLGLVRQDQTTGAITVAANSGGASVNFAGTNGARTLSGVANGVNDDDAVTLAQLKASGLVDKDGKELGAVVYDDLSLASATLGGTNGTVLRNVAPGLIASGSMDAVNGGQLYDMRQDFENRFAGLGDRVSDLEAGGGPGGPGNGSGDFDPSGSGAGSVQLGAGADAAGSNSTAIGNSASATAGGSTAIGQGSMASGENSTSLGQGSNASGSGSTAIGQNANAAGNNSVALGAGSTADRDNAVSVGSAGAERQITNVAAGTAPTDAVNVQQMNNAAHSARQDAMGGVAAAMAVAGLPQSTQPGRTFVAVAGSTYGGEYGSALGVSYMTRDGKWTIKASANTSSRGTVGAVVGGGFYW
ncbi:YadA family autotransporter adhesin [Burkholderia cepacia]|uniref:Coiled stalk of trimeric autotransporter adhesin family protein n=1 Tax=Burkholderia cepacia TaxID=292 RepID=A0AA89CBE4_BURCE|nr:ESPR-type extended signal peptide-containing protein [Burkholderia cepacia]KGB93922.1 coiled stalk of trimeric autotransporter adhesin family protein [Burkholderia cepacia]